MIYLSDIKDPVIKKYMLDNNKEDDEKALSEDDSFDEADITGTEANDNSNSEGNED